MFYMINICGKNYTVIHNSQLVRSISCISSYMFRLIFYNFIPHVLIMACIFISVYQIPVFGNFSGGRSTGLTDILIEILRGFAPPGLPNVGT